TAGHVAIHGVDMLALRDAKLREARRTLVSYVPQDPGTALNPALTLRRQLEESVAPGQPTSRIAEVLDEVGLPSDDAFLARKPAALSGG
ncbi:ABC transporter ATP-binding protein, partial [Streptomyces galilaeus]